jgi:hypothetical protein
MTWPILLIGICQSVNRFFAYCQSESEIQLSRMDWVKKLRGEVDRRALDMKALSIAAGLGPTYVFDVLKRGRGIQRPNYNAMKSLSAALGYDDDWLMGDAPPDIALKNGNGKTVGVASGAIPEIDVRGGMGGGGEAAYNILHDGGSFGAEAVKGQWVFPPEFLHQELKIHDQQADVIEVIGDSMSPTLLPGDRVVIDRRHTKPSPDGVYALWDGDGVVVKRIERIFGPGETKFRIRSDNSAHGDYLVDSDQFRVIGRVVGRISRM